VNLIACRRVRGTHATLPPGHRSNRGGATLSEIDPRPQGRV
ncbi:MAG: hypothetical protein AVDCRST_MAG19-4034, partial [uncultured Thermomicrobiales bacterium]